MGTAQAHVTAGPTTVVFQAGEVGVWQVETMQSVLGEPLPLATRLEVILGSTQVGAAAWSLRGFTSNERYVERPERESLVAMQAPLGRPAARCAALIPLRKSEAWWDLTQDERRDVFGRQSRHIALGLEYLPAIARRLLHARDLGEQFDFLTWFEYPPEASAAFDDLVRRLRETPEWSFVDREVDIRLRR